MPAYEIAEPSHACCYTKSLSTQTSFL